MLSSWKCFRATKSTTSSTWLRESKTKFPSQNWWVWLTHLVGLTSSRTCKPSTVTTMLNFINQFFVISQLENISEDSSKKKPKLQKLTQKWILVILLKSWRITPSNRFSWEFARSGFKILPSSVKTSSTKLVPKSWPISWNSNQIAVQCRSSPTL